VGDEDASFIVELRSDPEQARFLQTGASNEEQQKEWLRCYFERAADYYFVVQELSSHRAEGLVGIYNVDETRSSAEWGRWIIRRTSLAAVESCYLVYYVGFTVLGLAEMYCRTIPENAKVIHFHSSLGLQTRRISEKSVKLGEIRYDLVEQVMSKELWNATGPRLLSIARRLADARTRPRP